VKDVQAKTSKAFAAACFEAELLKQLTARLTNTPLNRAPRYKGHSVVKSLDGGNVRLAMSFLPGMALDQWLYGISEHEIKHVDVTQLVEGKLLGGRQSSLTLNSACKFTQDILLQIAPVFATLQSLAYHRDVSSHNVMIDVDAANAEFSVALIDFGLAVRADTWNSEYTTSDLAGDPRYWPPGALMASTHGFKYVEHHKEQGFLNQYLTRIDHYATGILCLEVLFSLWDWKGEKHISAGLAKLHDAWRAFWRSAIRRYQIFHSKDKEHVRHHVAHSPDDGIGAMVAQCKRLRDALRAAGAESGNTSSCTMLFPVLADLISENGRLTWTEGQKDLFPMGISSLFNGGPEAEEWLRGVSERMAREKKLAAYNY
jgi:serine/threonine protein kinase